MTAGTERRDEPSEDAAGRPSELSDFTGQGAIKDNLSVFLQGARKLGAALDHVLLHGPPGLGKTTLAGIIANELGVGFRSIAAPAVAKPSDLISTLVGLEERDVLFIDEIHRLPPVVEEVLYPVMEDFRLDVVVGEAGQGKAVSIPLPRFTLVGATTRPGNLTVPMRDRFGISFRLVPYSEEELAAVIRRGAARMNLAITDGAAAEVARRSRGTPRIALRLLRRIRDFAIADGIASVGTDMAAEAMTRIGIDANGLDEADRRYLDCLVHRFGRGPVGLTTLAAALGDSTDMIENSIEPYLISKGFVDRTPRGRVANPSAC